MTHELGAAMRREMSEQPEVLSRLLETLPEAVEQLRAEGISERAGLAILARGSSDNAARVAAYSAQVRTGIPVHVVSPSVCTAFGQSTDAFEHWAVFALSQSGATPEIVDVAGRFRQSGALVVGFSNSASSALADAVSAHVALGAGDERAVPATKTVTAQMLAAVAVAVALGGSALDPGALTTLPDQVQSVLDDSEGIAVVAERIVAGRGVAITGRAFLAAAAFESALKLQETTGLVAHAFSTADFRHGPMRMAGSHLPVLGFAGSTVADADTLALMDELDEQRAAPLLVSATERATVSIPRTEPELEALLATVRGQQLALHTATTLGVNPDQPDGLSKVTFAD